MKKIIKHGRKKDIEAKDYKIECDNCGCVFTCSCGDFEWQEKSIYGEAGVRCPDCNKEIRFIPSRHFADKEE